ncbi:hypothetical protein C0991_000628 [Blastosporella zonata]|nr:hypothetical protein C0991_000628 [Blastosporella zonata]
MSSKRGRKRNDNLPPNRARDVQRAFRARRTAHLVALEQSVSELEEENAKLRNMVGWPPDDRPSLGKGPTGRDKPKLGLADGHDGGGSYAADVLSKSAGSSPRTRSFSPTAIPGSSHGMYVIDSDAWENASTIFKPDDQPPESPYQFPPMRTLVSTKSVYSTYEGALPSSLPTSLSRSPISPESTYTETSASYSHSIEGQMGGSYNSSSFVGRSGEVHEDCPRHHFTYHPSPYQNHDAHIHSQSPPPPVSAPPHPHHHTWLHQRDISAPYAHRRAVTKQYSVNQLHSSLPTQMQAQQSTRPVDQQRMHEGAGDYHRHQQQQHHQQHHHQPEQRQYSYRSMEHYGPDGRNHSDGL